MACCTGCSAGVSANFFCAAYQAGSPSSVVTDFPTTADTGVTQDRVSTPFTSTEHDPHCASPQPKRGPCSCSSLDRTYSRGVSGAADTVHERSFTRILSSLAIWGPLLSAYVISLSNHSFFRCREPSSGSMLESSWQANFKIF